MTQKATQKKGAAPAAALKSQPNPRLAQIEAIAAKRVQGYKESSNESVAAGLSHQEQIEAEPGEDPNKEVVPGSPEDNDTGSHQETGDTTDDQPGSTDAAGDDSATEEPAELPAFLKDQLVLDNGKVKMKLVVDGKLQLVELESVQKDAQKYTAGDARLREAASVTKRLNDREQELAAREAKLKQPPVPSGADDKELDTEAEEFSSLVLSGTKEEIAAATKKLLKKNRTPAPASIDPKEIVRQTRAELAQEAYDGSLVRGFERFQKEFKDIYEDDDLRAAADARTDRIATEHADWTPEQVILEAAKQVREKVKSLRGPGTKPVPPTPLANRNERKENLRQIPTQRSAKNENPKGPAPQTAKEYVAEQRKLRGQG